MIRPSPSLFLLSTFPISTFRPPLPHFFFKKRCHPEPLSAVPPPLAKRHSERAEWSRRRNRRISSACLLFPISTFNFSTTPHAHPSLLLMAGEPLPENIPVSAFYFSASPPCSPVPSISAFQISTFYFSAHLSTFPQALTSSNTAPNFWGRDGKKSGPPAPDRPPLLPQTNHGAHDAIKSLSFLQRPVRSRL